jgi:hypothetical protein
MPVRLAFRVAFLHWEMPKGLSPRLSFSMAPTRSAYGACPVTIVGIAAGMRIFVSICDELADMLSPTCDQIRSMFENPIETLMAIGRSHHNRHGDYGRAALVQKYHDERIQQHGGRRVESHEQ